MTHYAAAQPTILIGGTLTGATQVVAQFAGQAPGFPGVNQINFVVPTGALTGDAVPIQILVVNLTPVDSGGGAALSNIATIAIR